MNKYDFKNIIKRIIVGVVIAFLIMSIKQCKVSALSIKEKQQITLGGWQQNHLNGFVTLGSSQGVPPFGQTDVRFNLNTPINTSSDYDYIGFKLWLELFRETELGDNYCSNYIYSYNSNGQISSMQCVGPSSNSNINASAEVMPLIIDTDNNLYHCFFSHDFDNVIVCPSGKTYKQLVLHINSTYPRLEYRFQVTNFGIYYNDISSDIVNGITGITNAQQQTIDTITNSNISGANTSTDSALSGIDSNVSNTLDTSISPNQLNTILTNFTNQLSTSTCTPITLPIPYTNENIILPCLGTEFSQRIPVIWALYELIITGVIVLRFWQHGVEFVLNVLDPYHIGANNVPTGGGK